MTLQQLKYVITVAETGAITEAANKLYISQPSLTNAIHELEKEMNIFIFNRTNKGISLSKEGESFMGYTRQVLEQVAILEDKFKGNGGVIDKKLNGSEIIAVPLAGESDMRIGYITHRKGIISRLGNSYLEALMKYTTGGQNL
ncbi:MAG: LysR family transcriptional regulator [Frisingicoccus sp.]|nr:LysR family transcriptional regulator [Frisingicoccus sp.]MDD6232109.1 LysR family transcriptional regulator [Frisingicoccus sp.]